MIELIRTELVAAPIHVYASNRVRKAGLEWSRVDVWWVVNIDAIAR
jgi:hypothetical protein